MASPPDATDRAYRIVSRQYPPFDGAGTFRWGSRWISPGKWAVHAAETYALAVLENLVHWQTRSLPPSLVVVRVEIPRSIKTERVKASDLTGWPSTNIARTRAIGDRWYEQRQSALLRVPSVVSPYEDNVLFHQHHPDFALLTIHPAEPVMVDSRLLLQPEPDQ